jgi:hypothetical protein
VAAEQSALEAEILDARRTISTDSYPMSLGELTGLYRENELIIRPAFQRLFRWEDDQKSNLIESILLGIPLPSIFVAQADDGTWELIDGLQRVSTILQLQGELRGFDPLVLEATKYLKELDGKRWEGSAEEALSEAQKRDFKRAKIDVKIIKRESSASAKFDLFQRLNSYGSVLTAQELRNAMLVAVDPEFVEWLQGLATSASFTDTVLISERERKEKYDEDLVLRFLFLHKKEDVSTAALRRFNEKLDDAAQVMAADHPDGTSAPGDVFERTFSHIAEHGGSDVFRKWNAERGRFEGGFLNTAFEVIAMGVGWCIATGDIPRRDLVDAAKELWARPDMSTRFATGKATEQRLAKMLPIGRELMLED